MSGLQFCSPLFLIGERIPNIYLPGTISIPSSLVITAITQAYPMIVTCIVNSVTEANTYIPGMLVKFFIPSPYGMQQLAGQTLKIAFVSGLNFTFNIDATGFDPFIIPAAGKPQPASFAPAGSQNLAFSNITNLVGFQSLNNQNN